MRTIIALAVFLMLCVGIAGSVAQAPPAQGYIIFGNHVIAVPSRLAVNDRIVVLNSNGESVFAATITKTGFQSAEPNLKPGLYVVEVIRGATLLKIAGIPYNRL